jgi:hypothetical protein
MADQVQEWAIEELWGAGASTNWPCCPLHPDNHPMQAVAQRWCVVDVPAGRTAIALIGALKAGDVVVSREFSHQTQLRTFEIR